MVSLLVVSHSRKLAEGVREFAQQMADDVIIAASGGAVGGALGSNPEEIATLLQQITSPDGTLVLADLAGAILAVETAIDLVPDMKVKISNAPLVEGAYFAAIEAAAGATLDEVDAAALKARELVKVQ